MDLDKKKFGLRLREARARKGYTQEELCNIIGISQPHYGHLEAGTATPSLSALLDICNALDTTPDALLFDNISFHIGDYSTYSEFKDLLDGCTEDQRNDLLEICRIIKASMSRKA